MEDNALHGETWPNARQLVTALYYETLSIVGKGRSTETFYNIDEH